MQIKTTPKTFTKEKREDGADLPAHRHSEAASWKKRVREKALGRAIYIGKSRQLNWRDNLVTPKHMARQDGTHRSPRQHWSIMQPRWQTQLRQMSWRD
jgi:hypothetical protein